MGRLQIGVDERQARAPRQTRIPAAHAPEPEEERVAGDAVDSVRAASDWGDERWGLYLRKSSDKIIEVGRMAGGEQATKPASFRQMALDATEQRAALPRSLGPAHGEAGNRYGRARFV
eukprot:gnl/TRDRNA2_/TRDRNA2_162008_c3_seq2.p1 gnl/TRDRNA2_/TRDRNA2_162008_c3~~gnl/TRDRNA2_/TRDRNA2_162008_c3_seq2.p1  ORF type:complete len:118 (-),score=23.43 gnl/TRDRNA2_/TRDRNA2_162008_c3_seq2:149-502(-)